MKTFHEMCTNPPGKGSANITSRALIVLSLKERAASKGDTKKITMEVYNTADKFLLYFRLKSEHWEDLWYDTVITLAPPEGVDLSTEKTVAQYSIQMASNIPSFAFTYAYVANAQNLFVPFLKSKFPKIFFEDKPTVRNPTFTMGFEKGILLCLYFMTANKFQYIDTLTKLSKGVPNIPVISKKFMDFESKMKEYKLKERLHREKRRASGVHMTKHGLKRFKAPKASKSAESAKQSSKAKGARRAKGSSRK